jgi:hypothetical protein
LCGWTACGLSQWTANDRAATGDEGGASGWDGRRRRPASQRQMIVLFRRVFWMAIIHRRGAFRAGDMAPAPGEVQRLPATSDCPPPSVLDSHIKFTSSLYDYDSEVRMRATAPPARRDGGTTDSEGSVPGCRRRQPWSGEDGDALYSTSLVIVAQQIISITLPCRLCM